MSHSRRVALVISAVYVRRLAQGLPPLVDPGRDFWIVDAERPAHELWPLLDALDPSGFITEMLPGVTDRLLERGLPTVVSAWDGPLPGAACVDVDDEAVGAMAAEHLMALGLPHFAFFGNTSAYSPQREKGFQQALAARQAEPAAVLIEPTPSDRRYIEHWTPSNREMIDWLQALPKPVGVFAVHDPQGRSLAEACRDAGLQIPEEVAIVGANDDALVCELTHPPLSSVAIPWQRMGFEAARLVEAMIRGEPAPTAPVLLPPISLVERRSSDRLAVEHPQLRRALQLLRDRRLPDLSVKELAAAVPMSRRTLEHLFRRYLGRSPKEEIDRLRLDRARELLTHTSLPLSEIAERSGYSSLSRFSHAFRRALDTTPRDFRRESLLAGR
ncbi:MAG: substrate-binding domain-containing protein [Verrucomicrobiota bacterium JB022]|nr:substrate-binding domain-containing protein [Verrucomicrobiota bacterium JB022]